MYNPVPVDIYWNGAQVGRLLAVSMYRGLDNMPWFHVPKALIKPGLINSLEIRVRRATYSVMSPAALGVVLEGVRFLQKPDSEVFDKTEAASE